MGHEGMAATVVRYLRSVGAAATAPAEPVEALPRPDLRAVRDDERLPVDPAEFRGVLGHFATGVTVVTARDEAGPTGFACQSFASSPSTLHWSSSWWAVRQRPGRASPARARSA